MNGAGSAAEMDGYLEDYIEINITVHYVGRTKKNG